jgi:serine/threonine protein kinase
MTQTATGYGCPRCKAPLEKTANFCANCGADISGVWGPDGEPLGKTIAVEINPTVDTLAQLLTKATLGDYDIYGELGRGGMAAVYLGLDLALNRKVAIKTMLPELVSREGMVERFKREAQTAAALSHPHIIQIFSVKQTKDLVYFVMKFIEGRSLESVINEKSQLSADMSRMVLSQVASALAYAHRKHVVHRDIKPANIMIDEDGWAIVTDFGIAKVQEAQNLTATGTAIGTPHYMSPEQFHNKAITGQSDQYSLGIVAYEMLVGKKPFDGATYAEIITQHLFEAPPDIRVARPDVPESIASTIKRMLSKDPAERFPDLDAVAHELGVPQKTDGVAVRTEMITLAKNGPQKKVRMSVPISPIPASKKAEDMAAATVVEKKPTRPRPKVDAAPAPKSRMPMIAAAAVVLLGGGFAAWKFTRPDAPATQSAQQTLATAQRPDSTAVTPSGQVAEPNPVAASPQPPATKSAEPAATNPPPSSPARVTVGNVPSTGTISVDGRRQSGRSFQLRAGTHTIEIRASGFETQTRRLNLASGEIVDFDYERKPVAAAPAREPAGSSTAPANSASQGAAGLATLQIIARPPATIYVDNESKGERGRMSDQLLPGSHTLRFEKDGFVTKDTVVTLTAGQTARITIELTPRQ